MSEIKTLEDARRARWVFQTTPGLTDRCDKIPLDEDGLRNALTSVFGFVSRNQESREFEVTTEEDPRMLVVDNHWYLSPQPIVVNSLAGPRAYEGWVLECGVHTSATREAPEDYDLATVCVCRSWPEVLRALFTSMVTDLLDGYLETEAVLALDIHWSPGPEQE